MTATTSKLGADMTLNDEQIESARGAADKECPLGPVNVRWYRAFARALLARQPAAIDNEADDDIQEAREILENMVRSIELDGNYSTEATCTFLRQALNCLPVDAPLANEASKPAPSVEQDAHAPPFAALCDLLPSDVSWGDALTPDLARHIARAASTSANVAQGAEAVATVKVYETYTGQNGWIEVTQEEYDRSKDKYEHRIRRVSAPPAQTALTVTPAMVKAAMPWLAGLHYMRTTDKESRVEEAIKAALTAAQSASGDKS
jgi:hypothetical protein